ncbi:MAG: dephospho-CoA kinase [Rikenellaceae bacterium]
MFKVGITGGIGSGKSMLCRHLAQLGASVYYSDAEAKRLMIENTELKCKISECFGRQAYLDGVLNRAYLAEQVFGDGAKRDQLNALVHPVVRADFHSWAERQDADYVVMESAILFDACLDCEMDLSVAVLAPEPLRIARAAARDGVDREQITERMAAQMSEERMSALADYTVVNIIDDELEASAERLDKIIRREAAKN